MVEMMHIVPEYTLQVHVHHSSPAQTLSSGCAVASSVRMKSALMKTELHLLESVALAFKGANHKD